jgi:hypothetical protein
LALLAQHYAHVLILQRHQALLTSFRCCDCCKTNTKRPTPAASAPASPSRTQKR